MTMQRIQFFLVLLIVGSKVKTNLLTTHVVHHFSISKFIFFVTIRYLRIETIHIRKKINI